MGANGSKQKEKEKRTIGWGKQKERLKGKE